MSTSRRILVVDDNKDGADSLAMMLRMLGNDVSAAYDGATALQRIAADPVEVVLLDIGMPKMNGYEVAKRIRADHADRKILLIALTGWGQDDDKRQAMESGFDVHMTKPVELAALRTLLAESASG